MACSFLKTRVGNSLSTMVPARRDTRVPSKCDFPSTEELRVGLLLLIAQQNRTLNRMKETFASSKLSNTPRHPLARPVGTETSPIPTDRRKRRRALISSGRHVHPLASRSVNFSVVLALLPRTLVADWTAAGGRRVHCEASGQSDSARAAASAPGFRAGRPSPKIFRVKLQTSTPS